MAMTSDEVASRVELNELLSRYGTLIDNRDWPGLDLIFDVDVVFDLTDIGSGIVTGLDAVKNHMDTEAIHPAAHIITNIYAESLTADRAEMRSRLLAIQDDGSVIVGEYRDDVALTPVGWRITRRIFTYTRRTRSAR